MIDDAYYAHLWFACPGIGQGRLTSLRTVFGSYQAAWHAQEPDLQGWARSFFRGQNNGIKHLLAHRNKLSIEEQYLALTRQGIQVLIRGSTGYPSQFEELNLPPEIIYASGQLEFSQPRVAIVGTRHPSSYGTFVASRLAAELAAAGVQVVSGLARGIDTTAHIGALKGGGSTLAILGSGLTRIYPQQNQQLARAIVEKGCLLSEVLPETGASKGLFPMRNRLIAAISQAVLVVEAGHKSGSMSTVDAALGLGRDVFAVPGPIYELGSHGTNRLIQDGAKLVASVEDILDELKGLNPGLNMLPNSTAKVSELSIPMRQIWESLAGGPVHLTNLVNGLKMNTDHLIPALMEMAMSGLVEQLPGSFWSRKMGNR